MAKAICCIKKIHRTIKGDLRKLLAFLEGITKAQVQTNGFGSESFSLGEGTFMHDFIKCIKIL